MIGFIAKDSQPLFPTIENKEAPSFIAENASVFTGEKTDVALFVEAKPGQPSAGLGIWKDSQGKDKYLTEIDDKESSIVDSNYSKYLLDKDYRNDLKKDSVKTSLSELLKHDKLFKNNPEVANLEVELRATADPKGNYTNAVAAFDYPTDNKRGKLIIHADKIKDKDYLRSVLIHEIQHERDYAARVIKDGKDNNFVRREKTKNGIVIDDGSLTSDWQRTETKMNTESLSEVAEDRLRSQNNNPDENYLVTQHLKRFNVDSTVPADNPNEQNARNNLDIFMKELAYVESRNQNVANKTSSAQGYFQFLTDDSKGQSSLQTAVKRTKKYFGDRKIDWLDEVAKTGDVLSLTYEQQKLLAIGDLMEKKGSDQLWKRFFTAKSKEELIEVKREIYSKLHHTDTGGKNAAAIKKNMDTIWK